MRPLVFAHRGSRRAPENTLAAFALGLEEGADGVELDVRTSSDDVVVVAHDPHLGRVGGRAAWVAALPHAYLATIDLAGERVPTLDQAIDLVIGSGRRLNIEVKGDVPDRRATAACVVRLLKRRSRSEREAMVLSTFDPVLTVALREARVPIGFLFDRENTGIVRAALAERVLRPDGVHPQESLIDEAAVAGWKRRGRFVAAWTVNDPQRARWLAAAGVESLITDDVPAVLAALGRDSSSP